MAAAGQDFGGKAGAGADKAAADAASPVFVLPPLLAPSAGAFAAATVMGLGLANQMAGAWLGMMKGAMETTRQMAEALGASQHELEQVADVEVAAEPKRESATILPLARKEKPVAKAAPAEAKQEKAAPVKAAPKNAKAPGKARASVDLSDLKLLPGIGPKLEQMLKARDIRSLKDVASLTKAKADKLDKALGLEGRIERDGWVAKAAALIG